MIIGTCTLIWTCFELGQLTAGRVSLTLETKFYQVHQYQTSASDEKKSRNENTHCVGYIHIREFRSMYVRWMLTSQVHVITRHKQFQHYHSKLKCDERWDSQVTVSGIQWLIAFIWLTHLLFQGVEWSVVSILTYQVGIRLPIFVLL